MLLGAALAAAGLYAAVRATAPGRALETKKSGDRPPPEGVAVRLVAYNIAHGRGSGTSNFEGGDQAEREARLREIGLLLASLDPDVIVLNEVDFDAVWSYRRNQAAKLAELAKMPYRAEQTNLDFGLPLLRFRFGNAILSRHPLEDCEVIDYYPLSDLERMLVGHKKGLICTVMAPRPFRLAAVHLEHRDEELRFGQASQILSITQDEMLPVVLAGDFNSTLAGFPGAQKTRYDGKTAMDRVLETERFDARPRTRPGPAELTFSSTDPRFVIDWILIPKAWAFREYRVIRSNLSDHLPVLAEVLTATAARAEQ